MAIPKNTAQANKMIADALSVQNKVADSFVSSSEKRLIEVYTEAYKALGAQLKDLYAKISLTDIPTVNINLISKYNRLTALQKQIGDKLKEIAPEIKNQIEITIKSTMQQGYYGQAFALENSLGLDFVYPALNQDVINAAVLNPVDGVKWSERLAVNLNDTIAKTRSTIANGLITGQGFQKTAGRLKRQLEISANKAIRIVRTESHRAQMQGINQSIEFAMPKAEKIGLEPSKVLVAVRDDRTRPQSATMDGRKANKKGLFRYPNGVYGLPGQTGVAEYDINDRESIIMQIDNWSEDISNQEQYPTFESWAKDKGFTKNVYGQTYNFT